MDSQKKIEDLLDSAEVIFRTRFLETISAIRDEHELEELATLLEQGRYDDALIRAEESARHLASSYTTAYVLAAQETAAFIADKLSVLVSFDQTNSAAVNAMRENQLRIIAEFSEEQRQTTRMALIDGITRGLNPRQQALLFRDSIGLTRYQWEVIQNYRRSLEMNSVDALNRELRDARFDRSVLTAIRTGNSLSAEMIDKMVDRYTDNWVSFRADTIARSESLRAVHEGMDQMYNQAISDGLLEESDLTQTWRTASDARVRDSHRSMAGQQRPIGQPFISGDGNALRYPGDVEAPISDTALCRCVKTTRFTVDSQS